MRVFLSVFSDWFNIYGFKGLFFSNEKTNYKASSWSLIFFYHTVFFLKHPTLEATEFELGIGIGSIPAEILKLLSQVASDHSSLPLGALEASRAADRASSTPRVSRPRTSTPPPPIYFLGGLELKAAAEAGPKLRLPPSIEEVIKGSEVILRL